MFLWCNNALRVKNLVGTLCGNEVGHFNVNDTTHSYRINRIDNKKRSESVNLVNV